jgi:hypothetical protein
MAHDIIVVDRSDAERARRLLKPIHVSASPDTAARGRKALVLVFADSFGALDRWSRLTARYDALKREAGPLSVVVSGSLGSGPSLPEAWQRLASFSAHLGQGDVEPFVASDDATLLRLALAWKAGAQRKLIARAEIVGHKLVVWSCEPKRYEVSTGEIVALAGLSESELSRFTLSNSGSRVHWGHRDVDLNMDTVLEIADPQVRRAHLRERRRELASYGQAIRQLREEHGLSQAQIAGLTDRQIRRLEHGDVVPHAATLAKLAGAHGMSTAGYLAELARRSKVTGRGPETVRTVSGAGRRPPPRRRSSAPARRSSA